MRVGEYDYLYAEVCPTDAVNKLIRWSSTNTSIVWVNEATGRVEARGVGRATIYATAQDGTGVRGSCTVQVEPPIPVQGIDICCDNYTMNVGDITYLSYDIYPSDATNKSVTWCSSDSDIISVDNNTGRMNAKSCGCAVITATAQDNSSISDSSVVWCDNFLYELVSTMGFAEDDANLIRSLYDKVEEEFDNKSSTYRAWISSRLIGGICYGNESSGMNAQFKWNDVAGKVFSGSEEDYFVNTLGFTSDEYTQLANAIKTQHADTDTPDFAHMQISLAARLAYKLNLDGFISNLGTFGSDETISYLAGWLGDATITNSKGLTSFGNDDYCADLDAENVYRTIIAGTDRTIIEATNIYYGSLNSQNTRADVFKSHISIDVVKTKIFAEFDIEDEEEPMDNIEASYPDTYDFICSLSDSLENMANY